MTECTEVSYIVPSCFFALWRNQAGILIRVQEIGSHSESYHAVFFRDEGDHSIID